MSAEEIYFCSHCGQPAKIVERRPRYDQPWYGDHEECRRQARLTTHLWHDVKRGLNRIGHREDEDGRA